MIHEAQMVSPPRQTGKFFDSWSNHRQFAGQLQTTDVEESSRRTYSRVRSPKTRLQERR
jgi:hypothetical protein